MNIKKKIKRLDKKIKEYDDRIKYNNPRYWKLIEQRSELYRMK